MSAVSGHVFRYDGSAVPSGAPSTGCRTDARSRRPSDRPGRLEVARRPALHQANGRGVAAPRAGRAATGTVPGMVRTGATVADVCAEYLRYVDQDRQRKPSTRRDYASIFRNYVLPHVGDVALEDLTAERVERWAAVEIDLDRRLANRTREKAIAVFHGVVERAR
jgi:Phage integrase, N-terminal SAM-like domain